MTYDKLKKLSWLELLMMYDNMTERSSVELNFYRDEINRRDAAIINSEMMDMTKHIKVMTIAITLMTVINLVVVFVALLV